MVAHDRKRVLSNVGLAAVFSYAEHFERELKKQVEAHLGSRVLELYGTTECGYIAGACPFCAGIHVHAEVAMVETITDDALPARTKLAGSLSHHSTITSCR